MEAATSARVRPAEKPVDVNAARALKTMLTYTLQVWKQPSGRAAPASCSTHSSPLPNSGDLFMPKLLHPGSTCAFDAGCDIQERNRALTTILSLDLEKVTYHLAAPVLCQASGLRFSRAPCNGTRLTAETWDN